MKKKFFSVAIVAAIALGAGWNVMQSENEVNLSDLALSNVEALAQNEGLPECHYDRYPTWTGSMGDGSLGFQVVCTANSGNNCC